MECNLGNAVISLPQSWDWLEDERGQDDEVSKRIQETVETKAGKTRITEVERKEEERRSRKEKRRKCRKKQRQ